MAEFRIIVSNKERKNALDGLRSFLRPAEAEPGCIRCSIACDATNPNLITFTEKWESQECLRQHIQSHRYRHLLSIIELSVEEPEIRFYNITQTGGLEVIENARDKKNQKGQKGDASLFLSRKGEKETFDCCSKHNDILELVEDTNEG